MKRIFTKRFRTGKIKSLVSGGFGKKGPYAYMGIKTRKGYSAGASVGSKGKQVYVSSNKEGNQIRIKHNLTTNKPSLRIKFSKKR